MSTAREQVAPSHDHFEPLEEQHAPVSILRSNDPVAFGPFSSLAEELELAVKDQVFPGAVLVVSVGGELVFRDAVGEKWLRGRPAAVSGPDARMGIDTVFDVASLTSIVVTTTLLMQLVQQQRVDLGNRVSRYVHAFGVHNKSPITVAQLLSHTGGLTPWVPFFEELLRANAGARMGILTSRSAKDYIINAINRAQLRYEPGTRQQYSDLGLILLGHLVEMLVGVPLDRAAQRFIFQPLGLRSSSFIDLSMIRRRGIHPVTALIAPTEECAWRKRVLCGEVHDDNAWAMGGVAGHSGLFSTANDLHIFAREMLLASLGRSEFLSRDVVHDFWRGPKGVSGWRYGWEAPSSENGLADSGLSPESVGACGFTGCSLWIDPQRQLSVVLMSNRIHPSRSNRRIRAFRHRLHSLATALVDQVSG